MARDFRRSIWQFSHRIERFYRRLSRRCHLQTDAAAATNEGSAAELPKQVSVYTAAQYNFDMKYLHEDMILLIVLFSLCYSESYCPVSVTAVNFLLCSRMFVYLI